MNRRLRMMMTAAMQGAGAGAAAWADPTEALPDTGLLPHTWFNLEAGLFEDSAKTTPAADDNDPIGAEENQGSDTFDVVQAADTARPLLKLSILNGKPMLLFDGSNDRLQGAFGGGALAQPFTVFVVANLDASVVNDNTYRNLFDGNGVGQCLFGQASVGSPDQWRIYGGTSIYKGTSASGSKIFTLLYDGANTTLWINGILVGTGSAGANSLSGLTVGARYSAAELWKGYIGQRIIYPGDVTASADADRVGQYLATYYDLGYG